MQRLEWMRGGREPHWVAGGVCPRVPASLIPGWRLYGDAAPHHAHRHAHPCPAVLAGRAASTRQPALAPASPCERTYRGGCTRTGPRHRPTHPPSDLAGTAQPVRHRHVGRVLGLFELRLTRTPSTDTDRPGGQLDALYPPYAEMVGAVGSWGCPSASCERKATRHSHVRDAGCRRATSNGRREQVRVGRVWRVGTKAFSEPSEPWPRLTPRCHASPVLRLPCSCLKRTLRSYSAT
jgi:hypothetical protein